MAVLFTTPFNRIAHILIPSTIAGIIGLQASLAAGADETIATKKISDGTAVQINDLGITITPPAGWEVLEKSAGLSLVLQEPKVETKTPDYSKPIYQRNITVAAMHSASPIDEKRAESLKADLMKTFAKGGLVQDYQIVEHKFFNYRGQNDGLLVYAQMKLGEFDMMQMNVLVSGAEKQFLLTYTDLADSFRAGGPAYDAAWSSMISINVTGAPPARYEDLIRYGALAGGIFFLFAVVGLLRRRKGKTDFDAISSDDELGGNDAWTAEETSLISTMAGEWKLTRNAQSEDDDSDLYVDEDLLPKTRKAARVSHSA